jgi:hypothetical protein
MKSFLQNYYYEVKKKKNYEVITSQIFLNFFLKNTKTLLHKFQKNKLLRSLQGGTLVLALL